MVRIKNDPKKYLKRSDLAPKRRLRLEKLSVQSDAEREERYLTAPIDNAGYIDLSEPATARKRA